MNGENRPLAVLLVEDDESDYLLLERMFRKSSAPSIKLDWAQTYEAASELLRGDNHDVYLLDSKLIGGSGTDLLSELMARKSNKPAILLTGAENAQIDEQAIALGAADYLIKGSFNTSTLLRSVRYAVERKQVEAALRKSSERMTLIVATQQEIGTAGLDLDQVMRVICERSQALVQANGAVVEFVEGDELVYRAVSGSASDKLGLRIKRATSLSGLCSRTGEILKCDNTETDGRVDRAACRATNIRSMIVVPLKHEEKTPAVLKVLSDQTGAFNEGDVQTLRLLAGFTAAAFSKAEEFRIKQKLVDELTEALSKVKTLGGLLPICANCKKVRDDKGYWNQIELFIRDHSDAKFSHGMCPECSAKFFPDLHEAAMSARLANKAKCPV